MSSLIHVGHWRFADELQPAVSHVRFAIDDIFKTINATDINPTNKPYKL